MLYVDEIIEEIDSAANDLTGKTNSDATWTKEIKKRLVTLGKKYNFYTYASSTDGVNGGEWLFDLTWLIYNDKFLRSVKLALESEWKIDGVDDDFQKLLLARAEIRVLIFQSKNKTSFSEKLIDLKKQISYYNDSNKGDVYLFSCWIDDTKEFNHEIYVHKDTSS